SLHCCSPSCLTLSLLVPLEQGTPAPFSAEWVTESVALPYWPFSSNDFWSYVEYFRTLGAYNWINDMARAFFAQFPFGSYLGYHVRDHED
uniref:Otospiralin n=1 Tax=Malurus cyaneus samueli TaxID=2593467 RepID=A0A8C5TMD1_9PASS